MVFINYEVIIEDRLDDIMNFYYRTFKEDANQFVNHIYSSIKIYKDFEFIKCFRNRNFIFIYNFFISKSMSIFISISLILPTFSLTVLYYDSKISNKKLPQRKVYIII